MAMLFDTHTNLMWYPEHLLDEFVEFAWEAKRAKMKLSDDVYFAGSNVKIGAGHKVMVLLFRILQAGYGAQD